jgi:CO dehydrogenase/acetyl-CoA synthase beta subunit
LGLFDAQIKELGSSIETWEAAGRLKTFDLAGLSEWPRGETLVLQEDCGLELGNPSTASLTFLMWADAGTVDRGSVRLVGPDALETAGGTVPFAQVIVARGEFADEYEAFRDLRDAVYGVRLEGFMPRTLPSRQTTWCRVSRDALARGFSLGHLGAALVEDLCELDNVSTAEVLFVTGSIEEVNSLSGTASGARRVVDALMKMYTEKNFDCTTCEYRDVCDSVMELKVIREKLAQERT